MCGVCQVLCRPVETILNRNLALVLKDLAVGRDSALSNVLLELDM